MARKPEPKKLCCPGCAEVVEVPGEPGEHPNAIVAICTGKGYTCPGKQWGSASTRVSVGEIRVAEDRRFPAHSLQLDPPLDEEQQRERARPEETAR